MCVYLSRRIAANNADAADDDGGKNQDEEALRLLLLVWNFDDENSYLYVCLSIMLVEKKTFVYSIYQLKILLVHSKLLIFLSISLSFSYFAFLSSG